MKFALILTISFAAISAGNQSFAAEFAQLKLKSKDLTGTFKPTLGCRQGYQVVEQCLKYEDIPNCTPNKSLYDNCKKCVKSRKICSPSPN
jgi:hypothetical protein